MNKNGKTRNNKRNKWMINSKKEVEYLANNPDRQILHKKDKIFVNQRS